ncbi:MAG: LuxR C-terminal-related transcriptional regulator [Salaquimonas sp.]
MKHFEIDLHNPKGFETVFPEKLIDFHTKINFTKSEEDVFKLLSDLAKSCGFDAIIYEYCPNIHVKEPDLFMRTDLPKAFEALERSAAKQTKIGYSRLHGRLKWTPTVAGIEYADYYADYSSQVWKYRLAAFLTGFRSGFGVALRSPDPNTRAGIGFVSKLYREDFEKIFNEHLTTLYAAAWAGHIRMLQHAHEEPCKTVKLTERQLTYLQHLATGLLDKQIAHEMGISHSAVRKYQYSLSEKLGVKRRADIITTAINQGLLENPKTSQPEPKARWDMKVV